MQSNAFQLNAFQQDGLPSGSYVLTAETGSYALTGVAAGLTVARLLTAASGSYALTGADAGLLAARYLAAGAGSYALTGVDVTLKVPYRLTAETGTYTLTGADATLTYSGAPAPVTVVTNKPGRRWYVVKGKRYYLTNEELAALLARDLIDVVREDVKVSFKNKKPHKVSKATWETLQQTIESLNKLPGFDEDEESAAMLLL